MMVRATEKDKARKGWRVQGWRGQDIILNKLVRKSLIKKMPFRRLEEVRRKTTWKAFGRAVWEQEQQVQRDMEIPRDLKTSASESGVWLHNTGTNTYPKISDC